MAESTYEEMMERIFLDCSNFPPNHARRPLTEMDGHKLHKLMRDLEYVGPGLLRPTDVEIAVLRSRPKGPKKLRLNEFEKAIEFLAEKLGITPQDIIQKAVDMGCPFPSLPPKREWETISPRLTGSPRFDQNAEGTASPASPATHPSYSSPSAAQSAELMHVRSEVDAARSRFVAKGVVGDRKTGSIVSPNVKIWRGDGGTHTMPKSVTMNQINNAIARHVGAAELKAALEFADSIGNESGSETPLSTDAKLQQLSKATLSPSTPLSTGDARSSASSATGPPPFNQSSFQTPPRERPGAVDLDGVFAMYCCSKDDTLPRQALPRMNHIEFRKLCREAGLLENNANSILKADITYRAVTSRSHSSKMDFDAFLSALERIALIKHLPFSEVERRVLSSVEALGH